jgi:hypothetical protein
VKYFAHPELNAGLRFNEHELPAICLPIATEGRVWVPAKLNKGKRGNLRIKAVIPGYSGLTRVPQPATF